MSVFVKRALNYSAFLYPNGSSEARVNIYCEGGNRLYVIFKSDGDSLPGNNYSGTSGVAYESIDRYPYYIDLLRNESPVWVTFNTTAKSFVVYASQEPVGEEEM